MLARRVRAALVPSLLAITVAGGGTPAFAAPPDEDESEAEANGLTPEVEPGADAEPEAEMEPPTEEDPDVVEAQTLFHQGADKFETADYAGAIELWTQAYGLVPSTPENAGVKARLIANIASAQEKAYAVDGEASHLNQAKILLVGYREAVPAIYPDAAEREKELSWVDDRLGAIEAELAVIAEREAAAAANEGGEPAGPPPGRNLMIAGGVVTGLGVGGLGVMAAGMVVGGQNNAIDDLPTNDLDTRASRFDQGRLGNALAIAGAAGGAVLLGAGVALLVIGAKRKREAGGGDASAAVVPVVGAGQLGLGVVGRF